MGVMRKILVVEDLEINRGILCQILSDTYEVLEAENGQRALEVLRQYGEEVSLILLDINMPVMDGYTFLSIMKSEPSISSIPVIVTTQSDSEADEVTALSHGAADFVAKPYRPQILLHRVASIIDLRENAAMANRFKYDRLTGLYSKEYFYQCVRAVLLQNPHKEYDVICSDVENFKMFNDAFGVAAGDRLLRKIAGVYKKNVGSGGFCGHLSADRFACLQEHRTDYTEEWFAHILEQVNTLCEDKNIMIKWGIYQTGTADIPVEQMYDRALLAAQSIKGKYGQYFAVYDDTMRNIWLRNQEITDSMESALADGQFEIYLQPKYRIADEGLAGAEALVRWNHPEWGIQSPAEFIPLFEKNGFISRLDRYVWDHVCALLHKWEKGDHITLPVSVNVSRADIYHADIIDYLTETIQRYDLQPSLLHLEITESAYTESPQQLMDTVAQLRRLGFVIEMDDFGSGYSSLNMLNKMPVDVLKLDLKFIQNEIEIPESGGILRFVMDLARMMKLTVVAEGVETKKQLDRLAEIGCDCVQGYYFARPMPVNEFEILLTQWHGKDRRAGTGSGLESSYLPKQHVSADSHLLQNIIDKTADGIYVIDKETYEVLYANDFKDFLISGPACTGHKCYASLLGKDSPCKQCTLPTHAPDGVEHEMVIEGSGRSFATRFLETEWNGIPAYIKFVRDITDEVDNRRERERLAMYFKTVVESLPGGISVVRCEPDGRMIPEYISDGFAAMTHMTVEEAVKLYEKDVFAGVYQDDIAVNQKKLQDYMKCGGGHCDLTARMKLGDGGYIWVKDTVSIQKDPDGVSRLYSIYTDITKGVEEKEQMRHQYEEIILQHYRTPGPDTLVLGHCNISKDKIIEIWDSTSSELLDSLGDRREDFFMGLSKLVVDETEQKAFRDTYLNAPALAAYQRNETEQLQQCYIKLPKEDRGRYVQVKMNLVEVPDTGDVTGILTITDITEKMVSDRILHRISTVSHDYVIDLDLGQDRYHVMSWSQNSGPVPERCGCHTKRVDYMAESVVVPRDSKMYCRVLNPDEIRRRLTESGSYTFSYSIMDDKSEIRTKNMTVFAVDLRLDRVGLVCSDITDSVREQQSLLNMLAFTFDVMGILDISGESVTLYTRQMVLENLPPRLFEQFSDSVEYFIGAGASEEVSQDVRSQFCRNMILERLKAEPSGYDFVFPFQVGEDLRYKQINVLWGDDNRQMVCLVRADVTDILKKERSAKKALEDALALSEEASQTKSDFLSAMSHDIRTPMNAIVNMTTLGLHYIENRDRVENCLNKIAVSAQHLRSLVNDVLDMNRIEQSRVVINLMDCSLLTLLEQIAVITEPLAKSAQLCFTMQKVNISHPYFYGDSLRIKRILINLISNAIKFTQAGGRIGLLAEEMRPIGAAGHIRYRFSVYDTGRGISNEFLEHIFDPFARESSVQRIEGSGLGLSIVKGLVDLMGGTIEVESKVDEGSVFRVELEFEAAQNENVPPSLEDGALPMDTQQTKLFVGRLFLVAEDNPINAEILCELLAFFGARCEIKPDGAQAVQAFIEEPPATYDAILMDIQMPVMNGYEAARAIRRLSRPDAKSIPIIAITANAFAEDVQKALDAGMNTHVAKPVDVELLRKALCKVLGS